MYIQKTSSRDGHLMRAAILATLVLLTAACTEAAPGPPRQSTEADITLSGPVRITLWHALSGPQQAVLDAMVGTFNETNGKGITVTAQYQGNYTQLYGRTLAAIQAGTLPDLGHAYDSHVADFAKTGVVVDLGPYKDSPKERPNQAKPGRHLQELLRGEHLSAIRQQAALLAVHEVRRGHVCKRGRAQ